MLEIILFAIIGILLVLLGIAIYYIVKFANIIFVFEDDIANFSDIIIDTIERVEQVSQVRALMSHPTAASFIAESLEELSYCNYLLSSVVRKSRMLAKKDYTELKIERDLPKLHKRLERLGYYDPEEDGEINITSKEEAKENRNYALQIKNEIQNKKF